ncbi:MAG: hypothetical protein HYY96_06310 [Candidatus Tectomicrobia bacterium]|nr:hypothetical protein [Candidatus Tectomicrobia bacterium]
MKPGIATVQKAQDLTPNVREVEMRVREPADFSFKPGQFISVTVAEKVMRPYSLAISPEESAENGALLRICVKLQDGGIGSGFLRGLRPGDAVNFRGPLGRFTIQPESPRTNLLFIATGTGISPLRSMITHLLANGTKKNVTLLHGLRSEEDVFYSDLFSRLAERHANFTYRPTLSRPKGEWQGLVGRCTAHLEHYVDGLQTTETYMCGNDAMINEVVRKLTDLGFPKEQIHNEKFG